MLLFTFFKYYEKYIFAEKAYYLNNLNIKQKYYCNLRVSNNV